MKKNRYNALLLGAILAMSVSMSACGNNANTNSNTDTEISAIQNAGNIQQNSNQETEVAFKTGVYSGTYTKEAMGSEIVYKYSFDLKEDNTYTYQVAFDMSGKEYTNEEIGTYTVEGTLLTLTPETPLKDLDASITGKIQDGKITVTRCVSSFASAQQEIEAVFGAEHSTNAE
ncbi:MAG: hypothetical protein IKJ01_10290 [Lachnospiraceae bacterium]|nr:hypothetical protein [Lachnospiraceae bacterium]